MHQMPEQKEPAKCSGILGSTVFCCCCVQILATVFEVSDIDDDEDDWCPHMSNLLTLF